jgi:3-oxoacyl-[acyl-carrier protein] reductase
MTKKTIKGKVALITGASEGLGRTVSLRLAKEGCKIAALARNKNKLDALVKEVENAGGEIIPLVTSVSDYEQVESNIQKVVCKWGNKIDILFNNAGVGDKGRLWKEDKKSIDRLIDTNIKGVVYVARIVLPYMMEQKSGHIFNVSSICAIKPEPAAALYGMSKAAVDHLSSSLVKDLTPHNIFVTNLNPGVINTSWWDKVDVQYEGKGIEPEAIADLVTYILKAEYPMLLKQLIFPSIRDVQYL